VSLGRKQRRFRGTCKTIDDLNRLVETVRQEKGKIDILVANSGIVAPQSLADATEEDFDRTFGISVRGLYFTINRALPLMSERKLHYCDFVDSC
jgi:NAD(P)-dependent dehydrogenase (short-subunit alcohol dehydrogenase family)